MPITDFLTYFSSWAAVLGMALLAAIGLLSGRFSWLTGRWSIDAVMRIHQQLSPITDIVIGFPEAGFSSANA